jgi:hypothetical protein
MCRDRLAARWYDATLSPYDPTWQSKPPPDQFVISPALPVQVKSEPRELDQRGSNKQLKTERAKAAEQAADFICGAHLFEPIIPLPQGKPAIRAIMARFKRGVRFPLIPNLNGMSDYMCFHSVFPPPHNRCNTAKCKNNFVSLPTTRLHVDPTIEPFKSHPETYWQPIVNFLLQPEVAEHFLPTEAFKALTLSTTWA